jgi:hypothetical protein
MKRKVAYVGIIKTGSQPHLPELIERYKMELIKMYVPEALENKHLKLGYWSNSAEISQKNAVVCATIDFNNFGERLDFDKYDLMTNNFTDMFGNTGIILMVYLKEVLK